MTKRGSRIRPCFFNKPQLNSHIDTRIEVRSRPKLNIRRRGLQICLERVGQHQSQGNKFVNIQRSRHGEPRAQLRATRKITLLTRKMRVVSQDVGTRAVRQGATGRNPSSEGDASRCLQMRVHPNGRCEQDAYGS